MIRLDNREQTVRQVKLARAMGGSRRRRRVPRQLQPKMIEKEYAKRLLEVVAQTRAALKTFLEELPALLRAAQRERADAGEGRRAQLLLEQTRNRLSQSISNERLENLSRDIARRTSEHNRTQLNKQIRAALGTDLFLNDRRLSALVEGFTVENVSLIKDLPTQIIQDIEKSVTRAMTSGTPHKQLAAEIEDKFGIGERRARIIARDQIGKLNGQVNAARQKELGVEKFIWRTVNDERVRPEHEERDGEIYSYSDPPDGELPGEPILCRCYAEPVFTGITEEADDEG